MGNSYEGKKCFVIMPFGKKTDLDGKPIDFNDVYDNFIKPAVESKELGIDCIRCDEIIDTGSIHFKMFHHIFESDAAIVDITSLNANVFYELGIRHALKKHTTLVIRKAGTPTPFNINGLTIVDYNLDTPEDVEKSKETIRKFIKNGLENQNPDSLVHQALTNLKIEQKFDKIDTLDTYMYKLSKAATKEASTVEIGIITGDIQNIKIVDVWVNPENTDLQMARHFDRSISGTIRYLGSERNRAGRVTNDIIANELIKEGEAKAGVVIPTGSGKLKDSHNVKMIFHAASVEGQMGNGYTPIPDTSMCVRNALNLMDEKEMAKEELHSILFPLMGTGTAKVDPTEAAKKLIDAALAYAVVNPKTKAQKIYFLAFNEQDLEICKHIFDHDERVELIKK